MHYSSESGSRVVCLGSGGMAWWSHYIKVRVREMNAIIISRSLYSLYRAMYWLIYFWLGCNLSSSGPVDLSYQDLPQADQQ